MSHADGSTPALSLRQSVTDYMKLAGLSERTRKAYLLELDRLAGHFACSPAQLSARQIEGYVLARINAGLKPRSTNVTVAALRMLYTRVIRRPQRVEALVMRKIADQLPPTLDEAEIQRLIQSTHDLRYRTAIELAYGTGLRIGEVVALKVSDIDSEKSMIHVTCGKGGSRTAGLYAAPAAFDITMLLPTDSSQAGRLAVLRCRCRSAVESGHAARCIQPGACVGRQSVKTSPFIHSDTRSPRTCLSGARRAMWYRIFSVTSQPRAPGCMPAPPVRCSRNSITRHNTLRTEHCGLKTPPWRTSSATAGTRFFRVCAPGSVRPR